MPFPIAWLYTLRDDSVRMIAARDGETYQLAISGPGKRRKRRHYRDAVSVIEAQMALEALLVAQGFSLSDLSNAHQPRAWAAAAFGVESVK